MLLALEMIKTPLGVTPQGALSPVAEGGRHYSIIPWVRTFILMSPSNVFMSHPLIVTTSPNPYIIGCRSALHPCFPFDE